MEQGQSWFLVAIAGSLKGQELMITHRRLSVGREETNDLVLLDDNVSRRHLELHVQDHQVILTDLGSRNGTFINNQRITGTRVLNQGDRLALGSHLLEVRARSRQLGGFDEEIELQQDFAADDDKTVVHALQHQTEWMPSYKPPQAPSPDPMPPEEERTWNPLEAGPAPGAIAPEATMKIPDAGTPVLEGRELRHDGGHGQPLNGSARQPAHLSPETLSSRRKSAPVELPRQEPAAPQPHSYAAPELQFAAPELPPLAVEEPAANEKPKAPPEDPADVRDRNRTMVIGGGLFILMAMMGVVIVAVSQGTPGAADVPRAAQQKRASSELTGGMGDGADDSISALLKGEGGNSLVVGPQAYTLTEEERLLSPEERLPLAEEMFDQAVSYAESEKFKEALREFNHALALDGTCDICMIRANKVAQEIRQRIEKYNSDGLRYFQAMKYEKAERSWERALLLLEDPQSPVGMMIQSKMAEARQQQARQSYR